MSSLSGGTKEINASYINLILYQSQLCENSLNLKNIFPYGISIQFDNNPEKFIEPIENINEIFSSSQNDFKYYINNNHSQKHLIKINCFTKSVFIIKNKFASIKIAVNANNINKNDKEKRVKKWYYLKNNNGEVIIKILLSIDIITIRNISNNSGNYNNKIFLQNENDLDNNISINKPNNINIHFNSISNNNLNCIPSSTYMSTSHYISSSNHSLKSSSTKTNNSNLSIPIINNNNNLLSSIIEKDDSMTYYENDTTNEKFGELLSNNILISIQNLFKKTNQKIFLKYKNLTQKKQILGKEENNYFKNKKFLEEKKINLKNNTKIFETKRQIYENNFLDLTENYKKYENNIYKSNIEKDLNAYDTDILLNINNMCINQQNLEEIFLEEKMTKNYFGLYTMNKNIKENEKSAINNLYNSKGYSFESNNYKNSLYLYGNGGNSNKVLFNIMFDNRSIYTYNNNFIIKPSPISFKYRQINKELSVSISDSKSHSAEKNNKIDNDKKRLTTDYSKSSLNILDDLYIFDEIPDIIRNKGSKSNNIAQNNLALKIDDIYNNNNTYNYKNKFRKKNKNNNKIYNNKKNSNNMNLICLRKNRKKITINDDYNNSYYRIDNKYYTVTSEDNKSKNKDKDKDKGDICLNKKIMQKKIENNNNIIKKDSDKKSEKNINNNTDSITMNKHSYKSIFKQKTENIQINKTESNTIKNNIKNNLQASTKTENNNKMHEDNNIKNKKHNRVFKNILASNRNKDKLKREKISSIITENDDNKSSNNSLLGINSILPAKLLSIDNNSRNVKCIKNNTNPIKNNNKCKKNRNCIKLKKKNDLNIKTDNLINHFYYINETKTKTNIINKKISFYSNTLEQNQKKNTIDSGCSSKIITKKNTNTNFNMHKKNNNTVYYNLINKKIENKKINNKNNTKNIGAKKLAHNKNINTKNISNFDSKISFYIRKYKTINDSDIKNNNTKNSNKYGNNKINNNTTINSTKNNKIIKINKNKNNQYGYLINNSHIKPLVNNNKNKNTLLSMLNNRYN